MNNLTKEESTQVKTSWLGNTPVNWEIKRVKDIVKKIGSGVTPLGGSDVYVDVGVPFIRSQNVYDDGLRLDEISHITMDVHKKMRSSQLKPNDILINITGASIGRTCIVPKNIPTANINQHIIYIRLNKKIVPYVSNYFKTISVKDYINSIQAGTSKEALNLGQTLNMEILLPSLSEQTQIADYLNIKNQKIGKTINLLTQKTSYYKELRKTLIYNVVTKGLDNDVVLKETGVSYIPRIKKEWAIVRVKDLFNIGRGRVIGQNLLVNDGKYPVFSSQTENNGCLGFIDSYDFNTDLLTWTTDGANAGTVFRRTGKFNCTNVCGTLSPIRKNLNLGYMVYVLQESAKHNKRIDTNGAKIMNNEMAIIQVPFPTLEEQTKIADYLDKKTNLIDKMLSNLKANRNPKRTTQNLD